MFLQVHPLSVAPSVHVIGWGAHTMFHVRFKFLRRYVQLSLEFEERISFSYQVGFVIVDIRKIEKNAVLGITYSRNIGQFV